MLLSMLFINFFAPGLCVNDIFSFMAVGFTRTHRVKPTAKDQLNAKSCDLIINLMSNYNVVF